jgi:multidrug efflux pump subunit AcrB
VLWDGEWEITWVTFRDMGAAFMVALLGIYVLVVAQFKSFRLPLVILTPIPLTLVGSCWVTCCSRRRSPPPR